MIAAVTAGKTFLNWFDVALVGVIAIGFWRGRKNGMSKEFLPVSQWLVIVLTAGLFNPFLGNLAIKTGLLRNLCKKVDAEKTAACILSYLLVTLVVWIVFIYIKRYLKPKLEGSSAFGALEYYLGILAGVLRYLCLLIFVLALLNAPYYTEAEIAANAAYNNRWYGGGDKDFKGDFIPSLDQVQASVFQQSLLGPFIKGYLGALLINTVPNAAPAKKPVISFH